MFLQCSTQISGTVYNSPVVELRVVYSLMSKILKYKREVMLLCSINVLKMYLTASETKCFIRSLVH